MFPRVFTNSLLLLLLMYSPFAASGGYFLPFEPEKVKWTWLVEPSVQTFPELRHNYSFRANWTRWWVADKELIQKDFILESIGVYAPDTKQFTEWLTVVYPGANGIWQYKVAGETVTDKDPWLYPNVPMKDITVTPQSVISGGSYGGKPSSPWERSPELDLPAPLGTSILHRWDPGYLSRLREDVENESGCSRNFAASVVLPRPNRIVPRSADGGNGVELVIRHPCNFVNYRNPTFSYQIQRGQSNPETHLTAWKTFGNELNIVVPTPDISGSYGSDSLRLDSPGNYRIKVAAHWYEGNESISTAWSDWHYFSVGHPDLSRNRDAADRVAIPDLAITKFETVPQLVGGAEHWYFVWTIQNLGAAIAPPSHLRVSCETETKQPCDLPGLSSVYSVPQLWPAPETVAGAHTIWNSPAIAIPKGTTLNIRAEIQAASTDNVRNNVLVRRFRPDASRVSISRKDLGRERATPSNTEQAVILPGAPLMQSLSGPSISPTLDGSQLTPPPPSSTKRPRPSRDSENTSVKVLPVPSSQRSLRSLNE